MPFIEVFGFVSLLISISTSRHNQQQQPKQHFKAFGFIYHIVRVNKCHTQIDLINQYPKLLQDKEVIGENFGCSMKERKGRRDKERGEKRGR